MLISEVQPFPNLSRKLQAKPVQSGALGWWHSYEAEPQGRKYINVRVRVTYANLCLSSGNPC